ncbi:energy transducer TonB [uncultured Tolumonas sp.]|uniref:energy transducer TonB n=1 Tax=uncultured Tolumonas sp. TaxID=263765 RepID=UPI002931F09A|nr:energy transducer TonB [uncultured Tolumonas sp.]
MEYHKNILREMGYPISFYLEDILYSLPISSESLALWIFIKRIFLCFLSIMAVLLIHLCAVLLLNSDIVHTNLNKDVAIEMSVINLNQSSDVIIEKNEETHFQPINPAKSDITPLTTNNTRPNEYKQVNNKLPKPIIIHKKTIIKKTVSEQKEKNEIITQVEHQDLKIEKANNKNSNTSYITKPKFDANYLNNPKPEYPDISIRLHEEGIIMLKVFVSSSGFAEHVLIEKSSGFERLDHSALLVVKKWRFIAAKQGEENISSWVVVPVSFKLEDE